MANKNQQGKRPHKVFALVTYVIALVALLLGMFLPFGNKIGVTGTDAMWAFQLPAALKEAIPIQALQDSIGTGVPEFTYSLKITFNGWLEGGYDLGALFTVLYALVVLAGICALVPAIVNTCSKKSRKNTALKAASFIEVIAFLFLAIFVFIQLSKFSVQASGYQWSWALLGAFGGTFVMLIIQSIGYKNISGVMKFLLLLLSTLALMLTVYDVAAIIPALADPLDKLNSLTGETFGGAMYSTSDYNMIGIWPVLWFFCGGTELGNIVLPTLSAQLEGLAAINQTLIIMTFILAVLALLNFLLDAMGLGKETKHFMLVGNVVRYSLTLVVAALVIILPMFIDGTSTGLMGVIFAVLTLVALILNIFRLINYKAKRKIKKEKAKKVKVKKSDEPASVIDDEQPVEEEPIVYVPQKQKQAAAAVEPAKEEPVVYNPVIYNGPVDDFINTLATEQKVEFSRVFLERVCGNLSFIPAYVVGGKNEKFFNNVFIYFARLRNIVSNELFNKMYEFGNLM